MEKSLIISYQEYQGTEAMPTADRELLEMATRAAAGAYAPYSCFHVGAAIRLADGRVVCGNNQENAAYPSGLCAERTALFAASAQYPDRRDYEAIAIIGINEKGERCEASPCGACRQAMAEYEQQQGHPLRVVCFVSDDCVRVFRSVADLLPFAFNM
ncbi:MAG: cytidine deaminase [Bacteroidales bacterium]|nr:cytidine deaminase [Bacteroidales bacterium]